MGCLFKALKNHQKWPEIGGKLKKYPCSIYVQSISWTWKAGFCWLPKTSLTCDPKSSNTFSIAANMQIIPFGSFHLLDYQKFFEKFSMCFSIVFSKNTVFSNILPNLFVVQWPNWQMKHFQVRRNIVNLHFLTCISVGSSQFQFSTFLDRNWHDK